MDRGKENSKTVDKEKERKKKERKRKKWALFLTPFPFDWSNEGKLFGGKILRITFKFNTRKLHLDKRS